MNASPYDIRRLVLRQQVRDRYRLLFFPGVVCVAGLVSWLVRPATGGSVVLFPLVGACAGMLPSLWLGTPSRMCLGGTGDRARIEGWMESHKHRFEPGRGWVPALPRPLYFDSQIVYFQGDSVVGPLVTLRKLRAVLQASSKLPA
jgi:hypothetical protein